VKTHRPIDFSKYPVRKCQSLHCCDVCGESITLGQEYRDGGYGRRAHVGCVDSSPPPAVTPEGAACLPPTGSRIWTRLTECAWHLSHVVRHISLTEFEDAEHILRNLDGEWKHWKRDKPAYNRKTGPQTEAEFVAEVKAVPAGWMGDVNGPGCDPDVGPDDPNANTPGPAIEAARVKLAALEEAYKVFRATVLAPQSAPEWRDSVESFRAWLERYIDDLRSAR
jgi:hypothetical protein